MVTLYRYFSIPCAFKQNIKRDSMFLLKISEVHELDSIYCHFNSKLGVKTTMYSLKMTGEKKYVLVPNEYLAVWCSTLASVINSNDGFLSG